MQIILSQGFQMYRVKYPNPELIINQPNDKMKQHNPGLCLPRLKKWHCLIISSVRKPICDCQY